VSALFFNVHVVMGNYPAKQHPARLKPIPLPEFAELYAFWVHALKYGISSLDYTVALGKDPEDSTKPAFLCAYRSTVPRWLPPQVSHSRLGSIRVYRCEMTKAMRRSPLQGFCSDTLPYLMVPDVYAGSEDVLEALGLEQLDWRLQRVGVSLPTFDVIVVSETIDPAAAPATASTAASASPTVTAADTVGSVLFPMPRFSCDTLKAMHVVIPTQELPKTTGDGSRKRRTLTDMAIEIAAALSARGYRTVSMVDSSGAVYVSPGARGKS